MVKRKKKLNDDFIIRPSLYRDGNLRVFKEQVRKTQDDDDHHGVHVEYGDVPVSVYGMKDNNGKPYLEVNLPHRNWIAVTKGRCLKADKQWGGFEADGYCFTSSTTNKFTVKKKRK